MQLVQACPALRIQFAINLSQTALGVWIEKVCLGLEIGHDAQLEKLRKPE